MKGLSAVPPQLAGRFAPDAIPVACECGEVFLWERRLGNTATCPTCHRVEPIDIALPTVADPALKVPADQPFTGSPAPVTAAPEPAISTQPLTAEQIKQIQLSRLLGIVAKESNMQAIITLPDSLNTMLKSLTTDAEEATARLSAARDKHTAVVDKIHLVASAVEGAAAQSEAIINQMMGGNGPTTSAASTTSAT
jgi:hypothetical protein